MHRIARFRSGHLLGVLLMVGVCAGAEQQQGKPDIPDPYGLGERLALIDYLQHHLGLTPKPGASIEELQAQYWRSQAAPTSTVVDEAASAKDRLVRLRRELTEVFHVDAPADADEVTLGTLLSQQRKAANDKAVAEVLDRAHAHDHPSSPEQAQASAETDALSSQAHLSSLQIDERTQRAMMEQLIHQKVQLKEEEHQADSLAKELTKKADDAQRTYSARVDSYNKEVASQGSASDATRAAMAAAAKVHQDAAALLAQQNEALTHIQTQIEDLTQRLATGHQRLENLKVQEASADAAVQEAHQRATTIPGAAPAPVAEATTASRFEAQIKQSVVLLEVEGRGTGTGFFVTSSGLLITNAHVVGDGQASITALWDAQTHKAPVVMQVVKILPEVDLALLRAPGSGQYSALVMHEQYELARPLVAVGFPLASAVSHALRTSSTDIVMSRGTLSAVRHQGDVVAWLQHDCRIASGNSGGPLIDQQSGDVIGVNARVMSSEAVGGHGDSMSLAIPIRAAQDAFASYLKP